MTSRLPELTECLPANVQLDGELIAWGDDGNPDFHRLGRRMLPQGASIPVTFMAFDVLALDGEPTLRLPYVERHALLEEIVIHGPPALLEVVAYASWLRRGLGSRSFCGLGLCPEVDAPMVVCVWFEVDEVGEPSRV